MNKILIVEDNLYTAENIETYITTYFNKMKSKSIEIEMCNDIYEANDRLKESNKYLCIVSDLNMNPEAIDYQYLDETFGAVLTGWVWVKYKILNDEQLARIPIIFYSAFVDLLEQNDDYNKEKSKTNIHLISKNNNDGETLLCQKIQSLIE